MIETLELVFLILLAALYMLVRPSIRSSGPFLVDAYLLSVLLYFTGSMIVEWTSETIGALPLTRMSFCALASSFGGAIFYCTIAQQEYAQVNFRAIHTRSVFVEKDTWLVLSMAVISIAAIAYFLYSIFSSPIISTFLTFDNIIKYSTLAFARNAVASGSAGYFAPGFIKQFRDVLLPISASALALTTRRPLRSVALWLLVSGTTFAMIVNGQRSTVLILIAVVALALYFARSIRSGDKTARLNKGWLLWTGCLILLFWMLITAALGRSTDHTRLFDIPIQAIGTLFDRAVLTLPRENAATYGFWSRIGPTHGNYWAASLGSIFGPGAPTDTALKHLSNNLSAALGYGYLGDSPLGLPPDVWINWGWFGLIVVPFIYAVAFGVFDLLLLSESSAAIFATKVFLFMSIPLSVSPYTFILYGGVDCIALAISIKLARSLKNFVTVHTEIFPDDFSPP